MKVDDELEFARLQDRQVGAFGTFGEKGPPLFEVLKTHTGGRPAMTFVRADNGPSLRAHRKMGMRELGTFMSEGVPHIALTYTA